MTGDDLERYRLAVERALPLNRRDWVVEIGSGRGAFLAGVAARVPDARFVAVDRKRIEEDKDVTQAGTIRVRCDGGKLPFRDISVHAVVLSNALHHMDAPTRRRVIAEARRVLRKGGRLLVVERGTVRGLRKVGLCLQTLLGLEHRAVWELQGGGLERELRAFDFVPDVREETRERLVLGCAKP